MSVTLTITKRFLVFPCSPLAVTKRICFREGEKLIFDIDCALDGTAPTFPAYVDVARFIGRTVTLTAEPDMPVTFTEADEKDFPDLWQEPYRPAVHFTVKSGWNNDPNGLIFYGGKYHMFFQYNPCSVQWGNMHWGHAVSCDLLHWEEQDAVLFPDEMGTMYSGSAIADTENVSGLGRDGVAPMLLYYTAAGAHSLLSAGQPFTQCLAFSADGGVTFQKYAGNPILGHIAGGNRDPKVVFVPEIDRYVMALYLDGNRYLLLTSRDLIHFEKYQEITIAGEGECPDLFPLYCEGEKYWVLMGAKDIYVIGRFTADGFAVEQTETSLSYSLTGYAAQSFSGMPDGRVVRLWWDRTQIPGGRVSQQMSIPVEMHLARTGEKIFLCAQPVREVETLYREGETVSEGALSSLRLDTGWHPVDLSLSMPCDGSGVLTLDLFGHRLVCDMGKNQLRCGTGVTMPLSADGKRLELRLIVDRCSVEIFADGGRFCNTCAVVCDRNLPRIVLSSDREIRIDRLTWHSLRSIH